MKKPLALLALLVALPAAAVDLYAQVYPPTGVQPSSAGLTINGGAVQACQMLTVTGGVQPKCSLSSITTPGTYTLVMTVSTAASIVNGDNTATNTIGGSASSAPFAYLLRVGTAGAPQLVVMP
jgi:hypothetical protein